MSFDLGSIKSAKQDRPRRMLVLGRAKVGKSTFAGESDSPIFLPVNGEEGIDALDVPAFPVAKKFPDVIEAIGTLYSGDHKYKTFVIDSASALEPIIWDETCRINGGVDSIEKVGGGYGKGFHECLKQWRELLEGLDALRNDIGMQIILIGHVKVEKFNDPACEPYDRYSAELHRHATALLTRWADGVLFIQHKTIVRKDDAGFNKKQNRAVDTGNGQPFMYTQERPAHPGGGRGEWGKLPYELPLSWDALSNALAQAAQPKKAQGTKK